jgi:hypothetical protein
MTGAIPPLSKYALMAWCLVKKHRDNFTFTFKKEEQQQGENYIMRIFIIRTRH